ncbi:MAG: hypothetical protein ACRED4_03850, partial [Brevundimonas sp.]
MAAPLSGQTTRSPKLAVLAPVLALVLGAIIGCAPTGADASRGAMDDTPAARLDSLVTQDRR